MKSLPEPGGENSLYKYVQDAAFPEEVNREAVKEAGYCNVLFSKYESQNSHPKNYAVKSHLSRCPSFPCI